MSWRSSVAQVCPTMLFAWHTQNHPYGGGVFGECALLRLPHMCYPLILSYPLALQEERSATKRARISAPPRTGCESLTYPLIPRAKGWGPGSMASVPRTAVGINEYLYALSQHDHGAVRCAGAPHLCTC